MNIIPLEIYFQGRRYVRTQNTLNFKDYSDPRTLQLDELIENVIHATDMMNDILNDNEELFDVDDHDDVEGYFRRMNKTELQNKIRQIQTLLTQGDQMVADLANFHNNMDAIQTQMADNFYYSFHEFEQRIPAFYRPMQRAFAKMP